MLGGAAVAEYSYYVLFSVPLTIGCLVCMIIGAAIFQIPTFATNKRRQRAIVEGGYTGVEKLLKEKMATSRAIYLPPNEGVFLVYVPVGNETETMEKVKSLKEAVEADLKGNGLIFPAPGSVVIKEASKSGEKDVYELLRMVLVDSLGAIESVSITARQEDITLIMTKPWRLKDRPLCEASLGSPPVSVAGSILSASYKSLVALEGENDSDSGLEAHFKIIKNR